MPQKETKHGQGPVGHPTGTADIDKTETGPSRLHAPGKPREVESGPSRLQTSVLGRHQTGVIPTVTPTRRIGAGVGTTEAGPSRIERYRK
jgi:hypothetical protein